MKLKILTVILLILLLTNIITATFNITSAFVVAANSPKTENMANDLLKNVDFSKKPKDTATSSNNEGKALWDFGKQNQTITASSSWGTNSTEIVVGLTNVWDALGKVEQLALAKNGKIVNKVSMGGRVEAVIIDAPRDSASSFVTEVKENGWSTYVEPNSRYQADMTPNDPDWNLQWGPAKIQADYAWNTTTGSKSVLVCVIDTGIDYTHPDLAANYVAGGYDWVNNDSNPMDDHGHGTHCAGIIGAVIDNNVGIAGIAQVRIMAEKGLDANGGGYEDNLANAIIDATNKGAKILSMSWGGGPSELIHNALKYAYAHGVLLVAAAGNSGSSAKHYPAAYDEVIAVTATDSSDSPASFTTYGDWVELAAPGVDIYSTVIGGYAAWSGTSMACPHVSGTAALVWSEFPNMSRDVLRMHLRDTADDLGKPGFDAYYGYGRINAKRAIEEPLPEHDVVISSWERPPYVEPDQVGRINATIFNYGRYTETGITVELLANNSIVQSNVINMASGASENVSLLWTPAIVGDYNVTVYVLPVVGETNLANNRVQGYVYVGIPLKVFVLRSAGTQETQYAWDTLNYDWKKFGNQLIYIDYTALDKDNITYNDLSATGADVLILSCAYAWEYTDAEIEAIKQYVYEGHGFIATAGTFYSYVPNNSKFAPMFGLNGSLSAWSSTSTDLLNLLEPSHPLFVDVPNPYTMPSVGTPLPPDGTWSSNELAGGKYIGMGYYNESAIVVYRGLVFISPWLEAIPEQYYFNFQILYNAITWSRYQPPEHELTVSLDAPAFLFPSSTVLLNATVDNQGLQNEGNFTFQMSIYDTTHNKTTFLELDTIPLLRVRESYTIQHPWNPIVKGIYNITAYATPVPGEENVYNNKVTVFTTVAPPLIKPKEGQWASYFGYVLGNNSSGPQPSVFGMLINYSKYVSPYQMNTTVYEVVYGQTNTTMSFWTLVNVINRWCEGGQIGGEWWLGMIETNITIGSIVNISGGPATVIGSETVAFGTKLVDCWKLSQYGGYANYTWWYAKTNGLWVQADLAYGSLHELVVLQNTNIPTGQTPEHELLVTLIAPNRISLGNQSALDATVFNYGLKNETNVELILEINGSIVGSPLYIPKLTVNESRTLHQLWTPSAEGTYNVTAYSPPVPGEIITFDNVAPVMVRVTAVKGHVLIDQTHAEDNVSYYSNWINSLENMGYVVNLYSGGSITSDALVGYDAFVTIQARVPYQISELNTIREFVANGGGLLVVGDDYPDIYTNLTAFAGIPWTQGGMWGYTTNITPHEITQGVNQIYLVAPMAMMPVNGTAQALVRDNYMEVMLAVNWYERGRVAGFADEDSLSDSFIGSVDNLRLATNMIAWLCKKDTTSPQILFITPPNGTLIGTSTLTMHWMAIDSQSGIDSYSVYRNGQFVANTTLESYTLSNLTEGSNNITIIAYDRAGNPTSSHVIINVDLTPPTIEILTPTNNSYVRQIVPIDVSGSDANFDRVELRIDPNKVATFNASGAYTYYWNTLSESYSTHRIILTGYDKVGHNSSTTITVTVDNVQPIAIITSPANNTFIRGNITITFVAQDLDLKNTSLRIDSTIITSQPFDTTTIPDGNYTIKLVAYDWAGNEANSIVTITIDNILPQANVTFPASNSYVKGAVNVTFTFADSNLENATLLLDGQFQANVTSTTSYSWNTVLSSDGSHRLTLTVFDKAGNRAKGEATVIVDNTLPVGEIRALSPSNGIYMKGTVDITFYGYDLNLELMKLYINGNNVPLYSLTISGTYTKLWDTTTYPDGAHTISLVVYDKAGNQYAVSTTVTVDNTPPAVTINSPQNDTSSLTGMVNITYIATDNNKLDSLLLLIDNAQTMIYANQTYQWDTTKVVDGNHTIKIVATDIAGNTRETLLTVETANAPPVYMTYIGYATASILGLALGALVVWGWLRKKPTPTPTSNPPTATA